MINKLALASLTILVSGAFFLPQKVVTADEPNDTRIEKYEDLTQVEMESDSTQPDDKSVQTSEDEIQEPETRAEEALEEYQSASDSSNYDIRRTEAFNLVSSAYRGDFEDQGINSYAVLITNYETGELTAENLIQAAIEAGELSNSALEDDAYVQAVESQLEALTQS